MNNSKKISVNYSSLVGLKAELLRKQAEVEDEKTKVDPTKTSSPKPQVKKKKSKIKIEKPDKKDEIYLEDVATLKKSKYMLEAKSRLYEKLKKHGDKDQNYLVDFSHKSESEDEIYHEDDYDDVNSDPEEDWVDYTDCFGRTRKCLRKDLPKMKEKDDTIKRDVINEPDNTEIQNDKKDKPAFIPPPKEPDIEMMRKKWEEQTEKLSHKHDIHYQDVLFDEARTHGVGYYAFSQDDEERVKQQENLDKLRKETEQKQKELMEIKELKNKIEDNRLKAARRRQRIRAGLSAEPDDEEEEKKSSTKSPENSVENNPLEQPENQAPLLPADNPNKNPAENSLTEVEDKIKAFGELLGKRPKFRELSQEEWIHKRRKDRLNEFAPVYDNFISGGHLKATKNNQIVKRNADDVDDPLRINTEGPEPTDLWECQVEENQANEQDPDFVGPVPPPLSFNCSLPPPGFIPGPALDPVGSRLIPPIEILRSVPPPLINCPLNLNNTVPTLLTQPPIPTIDRVDSESDSDDSEIIGPMPPPDVQEFISNIPLPTLPPPDDDKQSLNVDKISEGLKFLRQKFDKNSN